MKSEELFLLSLWSQKIDVATVPKVAHGQPVKV